jgi:hypothetical protein
MRACVSVDECVDDKFMSLLMKATDSDRLLLCARIGSLCARIGSLCARIGSLCARIGSLCARIGSLCARIGSSPVVHRAVPLLWVISFIKVLLILDSLEGYRAAEASS